MEPPSQRRRTDSGCAEAYRRLSSSATQHSACRPAGGTAGRVGSPGRAHANELPLVRQLFCDPSARRRGESAAYVAWQVALERANDAFDDVRRFPDDEAVEKTLMRLAAEAGRLATVVRSSLAAAMLAVRIGPDGLLPVTIADMSTGCQRRPVAACEHTAPTPRQRPFCKP